MFVDFAFIMFVFMLTIPAVAGYYAHSRGRSFWFWFFLSLCLPVISHLILAFLPDESSPIEKELHDLRVKNKMLGLKSDLPLHDKALQILLRKNADQLKLTLKKSLIGNYQTVDIWINKENLLEKINQTELHFAIKEGKPSLAGDYEGIPQNFVQNPSGLWLGVPQEFYNSPDGKTALFVSQKTGFANDWGFFVKIEVYPQHIVWRKFEQNKRKHWKYEQLGSFVFDRWQYVQALEMKDFENE